MATLSSQNGWPAYPVTSHFVYTKAQGVWWWSANADVAFVMDRLTNWYAEHVEPLKLPVDVGGQWSYAFRSIRGQVTGYSNHASATARDLNAAAHPRGVAVSRTLTPAQQKSIHAYLASHVTKTGKRIFRWGGDYVNALVDAMHFEIMVTPEELAEYVRDVKESEMPLNATDMGEIKQLLAVEGAATTTAIVQRVTADVHAELTTVMAEITTLTKATTALTQAVSALAATPKG